MGTVAAGNPDQGLGIWKYAAWAEVHVREQGVEGEGMARGIAQLLMLVTLSSCSSR